MSHPGPLLTDYVDGTLGPDARAEVDAHLDGCAACRDEVRLARVGKRAAGGLPTPAVPTGLAEQAIAEATRVAGEHNPEVTAISSTDRRRPNAPRWVTFAAAAAVITVVALVGPKLGQAPNTATEAASAGAKGATYPRATAVEVQQVNYTLDELTDTALELRATLGFSAQDGAAFEAAPSALPSGGPSRNATTAYLPERLGAATACLDRAFHHPDGSLARLILANYQGAPAYFGVYLVGPGAGLPPDLLRLDVASVHGCRLLAQSTARL